MEAELKAKYAADFNFHFKKTFPKCRSVMKGKWILSTKSDTYAATIIFMARWVNDICPETNTMAYKTTYKDVGLTTIAVEHEVTTFKVPFEGPSWHSSDARVQGPENSMRAVQQAQAHVVRVDDYIH